MKHPKQWLASKKVLKQIETKCRKKCYDENDADECFVYVIDKLMEKDYERLRGYKGSGSFEGFLGVTVNRLIIDFRVAKYGKSRIPKMVRDLGGWAEAVYRFVCWQKYTFREAYFLLRERGLFLGSEEEFEAQVLPVRQAPCRQYPTMASLPDGTEEHPGPEPHGSEDENPLELLLNRLDMEARLNAAKAIRQFMKEISEEERLMVRLRFGEGVSITKLAQVLGQNRNTTTRRLERLRLQILEKLFSLGIR